MNNLSLNSLSLMFPRAKSGASLTPTEVYENTDGNTTDWSIIADTGSGAVLDQGSDIRFETTGNNLADAYTRFQYSGGTSPWGMNIEMQFTYVTADATTWSFSIGNMTIELRSSSRYWYVNNQYKAENQLSGGETINIRVKPLGGTNHNVTITADSIEIWSGTVIYPILTAYFKMYVKTLRYDANLRYLTIDDILITEYT